MLNTLKLLNFNIVVNKSELLKHIKLLVQSNSYLNGNVKIVLNSSTKNNKNLYCYFIKHKYPSEIDYINGVDTTFYYAERINPNAKSVLYNLRELAEKEKIVKNVYEVLLVNKNNLITEGSRSNLFFIHHNIIYTPPLYQVLPGVTRKYVFNICDKNKLKIIETEININSLHKYTSAFLTGTSPKILPIKKIENISYSCNNKLLNLIISEHDFKINKYIDEYKNKWK